jgi:proteasome lid subunit RPN8/RPN11
MPESVDFEAAVARALRRALHAQAPREFVGLLGGRRDGAAWRVAAIVAVHNAADSADAFAVAPADFTAAEARLRVQGHAFLGFAHSHPGGPATPSRRDLVAFWPHCLQAIVGPCGPGAALRCYWRDGEQVRELAVREGAGEAAA